MHNTIYRPVPARAWSRVQDQCTFLNNINTQDTTYLPLTKKTVTLAQAEYIAKQLYKGNILQYKANSSRITRAQRYSQISKSLWCNRTKTFATQSITYSNPNTTGLKRINSIQIPFPNAIVGSPNNISGPFQYAIPNPYGCSDSLTVQDGGRLLCNSHENVCTGEVLDVIPQVNCFPSYCSDVPGPVIELCWNPRLKTYFPRQRYIMNNSGNKWPENYKLFTSAVRQNGPTLTLNSYTISSVSLSWTYTKNDCLPISNFNIYQNGVIIQVVPYTTTTITLDIISGSYSYFVTSLSTTIESYPSNTVSINL
jgi:hypothetical protein